MDTIKIRCFICDSPARSFIKGVANFNSKNGCLKCTCEGEYSYDSKTVVFTSIENTKRTDEEFRKNAYELHQKCSTPLTIIKTLDTIEDIIVGDRLHLIDLGVMKRLLIGWRDGTLGFRTKLSNQQTNDMSRALKGIKLPSEIHRKFRGLDNLYHWKASEFSSFLHYASIVVLKNFLPEEHFKHFLLLFSAITILSCDEYRRLFNVAKVMLVTFVEQYKTLYGTKYMTSNVHNLLHIGDEVVKFGNLNTISAYAFENELKNLKNLVRSGWKCLEQVVNRLSEVQCHNIYRDESSINYPYKTPSGVVLFKPGFLLKNSTQDCWFLSKKKEIVQFVKADSETELVIHGRSIKVKSDYFDYPHNSSDINVFKGNIDSLTKYDSVYKCDDIKCKLVAINCGSHYIFIPLLHTMQI
ncbi:uncharacterized protein LOC129748738 isoform X1 [Uranotaenia lowii]|uniref:uncharacterized protein LOC129748738 isoform X1 n=1 Tax=Uranotaenia lowii TaxID=190385 RepID=UPI00247928C7|nr:uncharacterized protein LOC129748738 isoform X1 [Uranotaenia lowii]XP_055599411.1 uncharacterized protein LOC129748738 isoform X1 [Uranotaenia lowii]XP_055599412.1 uncharacterized protein LOC129748738 isoform X1 [Uranotaenia lowii]XP_055599413.1 uncharacterized protein LOC129748738 isoform X1 [Uranotaenia lowii]XP_055599414.1 uncharacterized protein LOC129748738 isoform X1 [Uranotaenia lowii]XP_055599415.1 uncharacterized protein LOC129748738 isoform X1 [Uranotaenia lowii]